MAKINLETVLAALPQLIGAGIQTAQLVNEIVDSFDEPQDQETLRQAIADLQAENDEGHARYQRRLAEAARRQ